MHQWAQWLPLVEWRYNTTYHEATKMTPYEDVYGQRPPSMASYVSGTSKVHAVDITLHMREAIIHILNDNLFVAQNRMKQEVDQHRSKCSFSKGDQVFLNMHVYKQTSLKDKVP